MVPKDRADWKPRLPPCGRCKKTDHPEEACISKHDVDNNRLAPLPDAVYAAHKTLYFKLKESAKAAIDNDATDSSRTSDEASFNSSEGAFDDIDCVCALSDLFPATRTDVPHPRLVGVEPNPGPPPRQIPSRRALPTVCRPRITPKWDMLALVLLKQPPSTFLTLLGVLLILLSVYKFIPKSSSTTTPDFPTKASRAIRLVSLLSAFMYCCFCGHVPVRSVLFSLPVDPTIFPEPPHAHSHPFPTLFNISDSSIPSPPLVGIEPNPGPTTIKLTPQSRRPSQPPPLLRAIRLFLDRTCRRPRPYRYRTATLTLDR